MTRPDQIIRNIHRATPYDLKVIIDLQRKFSDSLGFIPREALESLIRGRTVAIATENGEPAGAVVWRPVLSYDPTTCPILQAAVYKDAQRRRHGLNLVAAAGAEARKIGCRIIQCWARDDLEDLDFWDAAGFTRVATRKGGDRRGRDMILFRQALIPGADIHKITPDPRHRTPGGYFAPAPQPDQMTLWPTEPKTALR